jgi:hypothetical protein
LPIQTDNCVDTDQQINARNDCRDHDDEPALKRSLMKNLKGEGQPYPKECRHSS